MCKDLHFLDVASGVLQSCWGYIGLEKQTDGYQIVVQTRNSDDDQSGVRRMALPWDSPTLRLRAEMHFSPQRDEAMFFYLTDAGWQQLGDPHQLFFRLDHFTGNRFGLFVQSRVAAGGEAVLGRNQGEKE